jgi:hypothetical protein
VAGPGGAALWCQNKCMVGLPDDECMVGLPDDESIILVPK